MDYTVRIPVEYKDDAKFKSLLSSLEKTVSQTNLSDSAFKRWQTTMEQAVRSGYTLETALGRVNTKLKENNPSIDGFTDRLKANIREQINLQKELERTAAATQRAEEARQRAITAAANRATRQSVDAQGQDVSRYESVAGRIGGRIFGNISGVPGGGFIGSSVVQGLGLSGSVAAGVGIAGAGVLGAYELLKNANDTAKYAQEQQNLAKSLGTSSQLTQLLGRVSEISGTQITGFTSILRSLSKELTTGGTESRKVQQALSELGLSTGLVFERPEQQINSIIAALKGVGNESERERLAFNLLGESGKDILPLVDTFKGIADAVKQSGVIIDADGIAKMARYRVEVEQLGLAWDVMKQKLAEKTIGTVEFLTAGNLPKFLDNLLGIKGAEGAIGGAAIGGSIFGPLGAVGGAVIGGVGTATIGAKYSLPGSPPVLYPNIPSAQGIEGARRLSIAQSHDTSGRSSSDNLQAEIADLKTRAGEAREGYVTGRDPNGLATEDSLNAQIKAKEAQKKSSEEYANQQKRLAEEMRSQSFSIERASSMRANLPKEFNLLTGTAQYQRFNAALSGPAALYDMTQVGKEEEKDPGQRILSGLKEQYEKRNVGQTGPIPGWEQYLPTTRDRREGRFSRLGVEGQTREDVSSIQGTLSSVEAQRALDEAVRSGSTSTYRSTLTPLGREQFELSESRRRQSGDYGIRGDAAAQESATYLRGSQALPLGDSKRLEFQTQAEAKQAEVQRILIEQTTKQVEAINKFNDSIDKAAETVRDEWSSGITSIIMGAEKGHGKGASRAAQSFLEGIESTMIKNTVGHVIQGAVGSSNPLGKILPDWMTKGTVFSNVGDKQSIKLDDNTIKTQQNTDATNRLTSAMMGGGHSTGVGGSGGGGGIPTGVDGTYIPSTGGYLGGGGTATGGNSSLPADIMSGVSVAGSVAGLASAGSALQGLGAAGSTANKLGTLFQLPAVIKAAGGLDATILGAINGSVGLNTTQQIGLAATVAGLGVGAAEGIMTASKGGAKNIMGGIAGTAAAIAPFTGPAAPFIEAGAAALSLVSGFLTDPKVARGQQMAKTMFTQQYLAPPTENLSIGSNGGFADTNMYGGVRTSNLSPYPTAQGSYLDIPRRVVVPGITTSQFGGPTGTPGAIVTPTPPRYNATQSSGLNVAVHVSTIDSKSFNDHGNAIADALHKSILSNGHADLMNTFAVHLGLR